MKFILLLTFVLSVSLCLGSPADTTALVRQRREFDLYENSKLIIQELISNWRNATQQGVNSITTFSTSLQELGAQFRKKLVEDLAKYRNRIRETINNITEKFGEVGSEVRECIDEHRKDADDIFNGVLINSKSCADDRINEIGDLIIRLKDLNVNASIYIDVSIDDMHNCTQNSDGFLSVSACLGGVAIRLQIKGGIFLVQSGLLVARINVGLAALPAALEICAGTSIVKAGVATGKVLMEVGSCSASSVFPNLAGNSTSI